MCVWGFFAYFCCDCRKCGFILQISAVFPDADECADNATNSCADICENTANGYKYVTVYNYV